MQRMLERSITVDASPAEAWDHLAEPSRWPSWARHLRRVDVTPAGPVALGSRGVVHLGNGTRARQEVTALEPGRHWRWDGRFLWMALAYDHRFEPVPEGGCRITFTVDGGGAGAGTLGRVFARAYGRQLDRSLPLLVAELASPPAVSR
jgi:uncharacterized protein YndB with AHSA1/START domain